jgi:hypothetical protein
MDQDKKNDVSQSQNSSDPGDNSDAGTSKVSGFSYDDILKKDILELMGFTDLPQNKREEMHRKIQEAIENRVAARIYDALEPEERDKYEEMLKLGSNDEAYEYLISRDIDAVKWLAEETIAMKVELVEDGKIVKKRFAELNTQPVTQGAGGE